MKLIRPMSFIALLTFYFTVVPQWPLLIALITASTMTVIWNKFQDALVKE